MLEDKLLFITWIVIGSYGKNLQKNLKKKQGGSGSIFFLQEHIRAVGIKFSGGSFQPKLFYYSNKHRQYSIYPCISILLPFLPEKKKKKKKKGILWRWKRWITTDERDQRGTFGGWIFEGGTAPQIPFSLWEIPAAGLGFSPAGNPIQKKPPVNPVCCSLWWLWNFLNWD